VDIHRADPALVLAGQAVEARRRDYFRYVQAWKRMGLEPPYVEGVSGREEPAAGRSYAWSQCLLAANLYVSRARSRRSALRRLRATRSILSPVARAARFVARRLRAASQLVNHREGREAS
jgi:hypothetical protein